MTLQGLEHRLDRVEAQHADYVSVLSSHTATLANLVAQVSAMQQSISALQQALGPSSARSPYCAGT